MLIGLSASQGQGKTTILTSLEKLGYNIIPQKTSRSILDEWNFKLYQVNSVQFLTKKFQEEMIKRHFNYIEDKLNSSDIFFQERTLSDIFTYCLNILGPFNEYNEWMNDYYTKCKQLQRNYDCVVYLSGRKNYSPEDDGVRSINPHFTKLIDLSIKHFVQDFDNGNVLYIDTPDHDERIKLITERINILQFNKQTSRLNDSLGYYTQTPHG